MTNRLDLTDHYLIVVSRKRSLFTRQARCGARFDQARLDRIYSNNKGSWHSYIRVLEHDNRQTLSNHVLITSVIELQEPQRSNRRTWSYLKIDHDYMDCEDFRAHIQISWDQAQHNWAKADPRIRWDKSWKAVSRVFLEERRKRKAANMDLSTAQAELQCMRGLLAI